MKIEKYTRHTYGIFDGGELRFVATRWGDAVKLARGDEVEEVYKFIWYSRHDPLEDQVEELLSRFGDYVLEKDSNPFSGVDEAIERFKKSGADDLVVVAPLSVLGVFCQQGVQPLRAEMELVEGDEGLAERGEYAAPKYSVASGRIYRHKKFVRVLKLELVTQELDDEASSR